MTQFLSNLVAAYSGSTDRKKIEITATGSFVVPAGVTRLAVFAVGGGGGGGAGYGSTTTVYAGGTPGAGGTVAEQIITVTPGETLTITIGQGGAGASNQNSVPGSDGGATTVARGATTLVTAAGGLGGAPSNGGYQPATNVVSVIRGAYRAPLGRAATSQTAAVGLPPINAAGYKGFAGSGNPGGYGSNNVISMPGKGGGIGSLYNIDTAGLPAVPNSGAGGGGGTGYAGYQAGSAGGSGIVIVEFDQPI